MISGIISVQALRACALVAVLLAAGCGGGNSPSAPSGSSGSGSGSSGGGGTGSGSNPSPNGTISATIDGAAWSASAGVSAQLTNNILSIAGGDNRTTFAVSVTINRGLGTYSTGVIDPQNVVVSTLTVSGSPAGWTSGPTSGRGSITITSFTSTTAAGTFTLTLDPTPGTGATGTKTVTGGAFNVTFTSASAPPAAGRITGTIGATVDGVAWRGAVNAFATNAGGIVAVVGQDTNLRHISIAIVGGGVGTYSLTFPTPGSHATMQFGGQVWDTALPGGTGSVTVVTRTDTRVTGTFFFTMQPGLGNNGAVSQVTSGTFDLGF
jgi:hypothetical protein